MSRRFWSVVSGTFFALLTFVAPLAALPPARYAWSHPAPYSLFSSVSFPPADTAGSAPAPDAAPPPAIQSSHSEGVGVGVKVGWLFSALSGDNINVNNRQGLIGGLWFGGNRSRPLGVM